MDVFGPANELVANRVSANAANGKLLAANDDGLVRITMLGAMLYFIHTAHGSELARLAHYFLKLIGSHGTLFFRTSVGDAEIRGNLGQRREAQTAAAYIQIIA